jgi:hypothetical protein
MDTSGAEKLLEEILSAHFSISEARRGKAAILIRILVNI